MRRLSLAMMATGRLADDFKGGPEGQGATRPGQVLAAFKAAVPYLDYSPRMVHAIDWLFTFTQPQDWVEGSRPVVWPSAALQREALGLGPSQVKSINRTLIELGLITMKDSPNGKRYGKRDRAGRIVEAYGFDLTPLYTRMAEFQAIAAKGRDDRERMRTLRRRTTIARNGLLQILDTVAEQGLFDPGWQKLEQEGRALAKALRIVEQLDEMELGVTSLERRRQEALDRLEKQLAAAAPSSPEAVNPDPTGPENRPHQYNYKANLNPYKETVAAYESSKTGAEGSVDHSQTSAMRPGSEEGQGGAPRAEAGRTDSGTVLRINTEELVRLAPRLRSYLRTSAPAWPDIVEAADWLRHDLGVSKPLWGEACMAMGREKAAIALAIVSAKPAEHFTSSPGCYFFGMVQRAKTGELNLARTIWGLRENPKRHAGKPPRRSNPNSELMNS
jgi:replication initiation protein RepC